MGTFDTVHTENGDPRFCCSEGHAITDMQTKCFGATMGSISIIGDTVELNAGGWGDPPPKRPLIGRFYVYGSCDECPAFVQARTGNVVKVDCEFELVIVDDAIRSVERTSRSTPEQMEWTPQQEWMKDCKGPMPVAEAEAMSRRIWNERWK